MPFETRYLWAIAPSHPPQPVLYCAGCSAPRPFRPSGKFRLNANGKQMDCWLIYKFTECEATWNRPLFQRRAVASLGADTLLAIQANDMQWAEPLLYDVADLRRHSHAIKQSPDYVIIRQIISAQPADVGMWILEVRLLHSCSIRLEKLLARELGVTRSRLPALVQAGELAIHAGGLRDLRRPVRDGLIVSCRMRLSD